MRLELMPRLRPDTILALWFAMGSLTSAQPAGPSGPPPSACAALAAGDSKQLPNPTTVIASARPQPDTPAAGQIPAMPAHCEVVGRMNERIGFNSQHYAINFRLRLPTAWNGRFFFQGGGGTNGNLGNAIGGLQGNQPTTALAQGYAVVSQDSGHDNIVNNNPTLNGAQHFGFDPQARLDLGYQSYDQVTQVAKALIRAYYGRGPERSYFVGCSEGGREGLMMSQRFPEHFDGILAVAPGLNIPDTMAGAAWDTRALAALARSEGLVDAAGLPLINKTFTDADLELAAKAVLAACDDFDGVADGMVNDRVRCTTAAVLAKLAAVTCTGPKQATCLSTGQVTALKTMFAGATDSQGRVLYPDFPWDAGIGGRAGTTSFTGWRNWKMGNYQTPENSAVNLGFVASAAAGVLTTPPIPRATYGTDLVRYFVDYPFDTHAARTAATSGLYRESVTSFMRANGTDLSAFRKRGGRLIVVHGASDPIFSLHDVVAWWKGVDAAEKGQAAQFARLFDVPGMEHCAGGPATDQFDAFGSVVAWVERGVAPDRILATARNSTPWPGRTRPLCPYPTHARYTGTGSIEDAANFMCQ